jgi:transposase
MDYQIKNHEWERIVCILSAIQGIKTKNELKLRRFIEAIWFIARTGCQWRLLPLTYSAWRSVHQRFMRWNKKAQRYDDVEVYKERHLIECFFGKLKQFRRIFSRFDKCADTFLSFIHFVSTLIWLR